MGFISHRERGHKDGSHLEISKEGHTDEVRKIAEKVIVHAFHSLIVAESGLYWTSQLRSSV